ncbi:MAG: GvpL/GvpF family gas vesicle protein [Micromonospora sp.]
MTSAEAVHQLLEAHHDRFATTLNEFEDLIQYTVHGRFDEQELISEILAANRGAAELAEQVRGRPETTTREQRIRLGEMISQGVELRREAESRELIETLTPYAVLTAPRVPSHELDALNVAFLVGANEEDFVRTLEDFADQRRDLIRMRLIGPLAPYDFVSAHQLVQ